MSEQAKAQAQDSDSPQNPEDFPTGESVPMRGIVVPHTSKAGLPLDGRRYIPRTLVARRLGVSVKQLSDAFEGNLVFPVKNKQGQVFYAWDEVERMAAWFRDKDQQTIDPITSFDSPYDIQLAKEVFVMFEEKKTALEVMMTKEIPVPLVEKLAMDYARLKNSFFMQYSDLLNEKFRALLGKDVSPHKNERGFVDNILRLESKLLTPEEHKVALKCESCFKQGKPPGKAINCQECTHNVYKEGFKAGVQSVKMNQAIKAPLK
jgi:hypothetical protein